MVQSEVAVGLRELLDSVQSKHHQAKPSLRRVGRDLTRDLGAKRNQLLAGLDGHRLFVSSAPYRH